MSFLHSAQACSQVSFLGFIAADAVSVNTSGMATDNATRMPSSLELKMFDLRILRALERTPLRRF